MPGQVPEDRQDVDLDTLVLGFLGLSVGVTEGVVDDPFRQADWVSRQAVRQACDDEVGQGLSACLDTVSSFEPPSQGELLAGGQLVELGLLEAAHDCALAQLLPQQSGCQGFLER